MNPHPTYFEPPLIPLEACEKPDLHTDTLPGMEFMP